MPEIEAYSLFVDFGYGVIEMKKVVFTVALTACMVIHTARNQYGFPLTDGDRPALLIEMKAAFAGQNKNQIVPIVRTRAACPSAGKLTEPTKAIRMDHRRKLDMVQNITSL